MSNAFYVAYAKVIGKIERGYSNNPKDSGGETIYGLTERVARANGWHGPMKDMPESFAETIYRAQYWDTIAGDRIAEMSPAIATELFEQNVNLPFARAGLSLQRCLNVLNREQRDYKDITADGQIGPVTLYALTAYLTLRGAEGELVLLRMLNCLQGSYYIELAELRQKDETFVTGWFRLRVSI